MVTWSASCVIFARSRMSLITCNSCHPLSPRALTETRGGRRTGPCPGGVATAATAAPGPGRAPALPATCTAPCPSAAARPAPAVPTRLLRVPSLPATARQAAPSQTKTCGRIIPDLKRHKRCGAPCNVAFIQAQTHILMAGWDQSTELIFISREYIDSAEGHLMRGCLRLILMCLHCQEAGTHPGCC